RFDSYILMSILLSIFFFLFFFFNSTATTEIYTLSLHDALPISEYRDNFYLQLRRYRKFGYRCAAGDLHLRLQWASPGKINNVSTRIAIAGQRGLYAERHVHLRCGWQSRLCYAKR